MKDYSTYSDQELSTFLRNGDDAAFKSIYQKYWKKMLVVAAKRLGDVQEAEELLQDIFLNLWARREDFNLRIGFDNYFAMAVKFQIINRLAKRVREEVRNEDFASGLNHVVPEALQKFDLEYLQQQLQHTISSLPEKCQIVFRLSREQELTNKEIAEELQISEKTVEKHMTTALKVLRGRFGNWLPILLLLV